MGCDRGIVGLMESGEPPTAEPEDSVDVTLIRWMLSLSAEERLAVLQGFVDSAAELRRVAVPS